MLDKVYSYQSILTLGGWTAVQMISFTESNLRLEDTVHGTTSRVFLTTVITAIVTGTALQQLRNEMGFKQHRFYCHKKKVGVVVPGGGSSEVFYRRKPGINSAPGMCLVYSSL